MKQKHVKHHDATDIKILEQTVVFVFFVYLYSYLYLLKWFLQEIMKYGL